MEFRLKDWYLGPWELFAVLIPGGIALFVIRWIVVAEDIVDKSWPNTTLDWAAFIVLAFILGYLAHPPSHILNELYNRTYRRWRRRKGDPLLLWARDTAGDDLGPNDSLYAWAKSELSSRSAEQELKIELIEGVSKMFRTLTLLLLLSSIGAAVFAGFELGLGLALMAVGSFFVFAERRYSATKEVYQRLKSILERQRA